MLADSQVYSTLRQMTCLTGSSRVLRQFLVIRPPFAAFVLTAAGFQGADLSADRPGGLWSDGRQFKGDVKNLQSRTPTAGRNPMVRGLADFASTTFVIDQRPVGLCSQRDVAPHSALRLRNARHFAPACARHWWFSRSSET